MSEHLDDGDSAVRVVVLEAFAATRVAARGGWKGELESGLRSFFAAMRSFTLATENGVDHVGREHEAKVFTFRAARHKFLGCGDVVEDILEGPRSPQKPMGRMYAQHFATFRGGTLLRAAPIIATKRSR